MGELLYFPSGNKGHKRRSGLDLDDMKELGLRIFPLHELRPDLEPDLAKIWQACKYGQITVALAVNWVGSIESRIIENDLSRTYATGSDEQLGLNS